MIMATSVHHEVSKPRLTDVSWYAVRKGPRTMGPPHRGQCQAGVVDEVSAGGGGRRSTRRARASRAVRQ